MNSEERAQSHNWSEKALISHATCITIANAISTHSRTSLCNEREIKEGILHAWRAFTTGCSSERAITRGVIHASSLTQSRLLKLKAL